MAQVWVEVASPVGPLTLVGDGRSLTGVWFEGHRPSTGTVDRPDGVQAGDDPVLAAAADQLAEYFSGGRTVFDLPVQARGTAFQHRVWAALREIPYGETVGYGDIARRLGLGPAASRAVGLANGANPVSVVVPCHRVIGADGTLTGYGGGLERKRFLLDLERGALF